MINYFRFFVVLALVVAIAFAAGFVYIVFVQEGGADKQVGAPQSLVLETRLNC